MEFRIEKDELLGALYLAQGIVDRKVTLPVLAHVLIDVGTREATLMATDQEIGLRRKCTIAGGKKGSITANARVFYEIVRSLNDGEVELHGVDRHQLEIRQGRSRFRILGVDPNEFPAMPSAPEPGKSSVAIDAEVLRRMFELTVFAASADEARPALCGVFIERRDGVLNFVATDGHRLSVVTRPIKGLRPEAGVILARKAVTEMLKVLDAASGEVRLSFAPGIVFLTAGDVELAMRTVQAEFPSYDAVIRRESPRILTVGAGLWGQALRRVSVVASERTHGVKLSLTVNKLEVSSANPDVGEASEEIEAEYKGEAFSVGFNARYLLDVVQLVPTDATIEAGFKDEQSPAVFSVPDEPEFLYVVMPMRMA